VPGPRRVGGSVALSGAKGATSGHVPFAPLRVTGAVLVALLAIAPCPLAAQLHGQRWDVTPEADRATVGDTVTLRFRVRLDERDLLFDTVPRPALTPPDWIRILSVEKLQRQPDRIFTGRARIAFYRPGRQQVPIFQLPFMRSVKGLSRGTLSSDSAAVEIVPVLRAGASATLRDIKEPPRAAGPDPLELLLGLGALTAAGWLAWRARRRSSTASPEAAPVSDAAPPPAPDPYEVALARLAAIAGERWAARDVVRHYEAVADALRDYLEAHGVPARERTTSELRWALPPALLAGSTRRRYEGVFGAADLVKFAHWRPGVGEAEVFLRGATALLDRWREAEGGAVGARAGEGTS
jgi:hypothetical protein